VHCLSSGSSREKMASPPLVAKLALLVRMNDAWDSLHKGLLEALHVPRQLSCSASGVWCMGDYFLSHNLLRFAPPVRRFSGVPASPRIPWSLPSLRQPCLQVLPRIMEGTAKKRRLSKKFSACLTYWTCPAILPSCCHGGFALADATADLAVYGFDHATSCAAAIAASYLLPVCAKLDARKLAKWRMIRGNLEFPGLCCIRSCVGGVHECQPRSYGLFPMSMGPCPSLLLPVPRVAWFASASEVLCETCSGGATCPALAAHRCAGILRHGGHLLSRGLDWLSAPLVELGTVGHGPFVPFSSRCLSNSSCALAAPV
jgi:hypothetical protein